MKLPILNLSGYENGNFILHSLTSVHQSYHVTSLWALGSAQVSASSLAFWYSAPFCLYLANSAHPISLCFCASFSSKLFTEKKMGALLLLTRKRYIKLNLCFSHIQLSTASPVWNKTPLNPSIYIFYHSVSANLPQYLHRLGIYSLIVVKPFFNGIHLPQSDQQS